MLLVKIVRTKFLHYVDIVRPYFSEIRYLVMPSFPAFNFCSLFYRSYASIFPKYIVSKRYNFYLIYYSELAASVVVNTHVISFFREIIRTLVVFTVQIPIGNIHQAKALQSIQKEGCSRKGGRFFSCHFIFFFLKILTSDL